LHDTGPTAAGESTWRWLRRRLFSSLGNTLVTLAGGGLAVWALLSFLDWALVDAVWRREDAAQCARAAGACWAVIDARGRLILFGLYPYDEHWRSALACAAIVLTIVLSCLPVNWTGRRIATIWIVGYLAFVLLMHGGVMGVPVVKTSMWGGLSLTIFVFASVAVIGMPLAVALALARRSRLPAIRWLAILLIDFTRSLPLLTILFTAAVVIPFVVPDWLQGNKLYRVILAFSVFFACYQAEIIRGGLQAVPAGQEDAAVALGLGYRARVFKVLLPQAFRHALPATINQFVITFKETSVVVIIGFFDIMASGNAAFGTGEWTGAYVEVYVFIAFIYFLFVFGLSRYGAFLESRMRVGQA
jgi:general L-amino acid transport system permease protein